MNDLFLSLIVGAIFFVALFIFLIKPQMDRLREHRKLINSLKVGDEVLTAGGMLGVITEIIDEEYIALEVTKKTIVKIRKDFVYKVII